MGRYGIRTCRWRTCKWDDGYSSSIMGSRDGPGFGSSCLKVASSSGSGTVAVLKRLEHLYSMLLCMTRGMRIEELHDRTRSVVRKAARLSQNSWGSKPKFVANVALREVTSGLFVSVRGDEVSGQLMLAICASHICLLRR